MLFTGQTFQMPILWRAQKTLMTEMSTSPVGQSKTTFQTWVSRAAGVVLNVFCGFVVKTEYREYSII